MRNTEALWTRNFILICVAHLALSLSFYSTMPIMPLFLEDRFAVSGLLLGLIVASYTVPAIVIRPFAGFALDRLGRMRVYLPSYLLFGLLFFLYPLAGGWVFLLFLRLTHGAFWGSVMGGANTLAVDLVPASRRGEGIGLFGLTMTLGTALGPAIGMPLSRFFGYDALFITGGALLLAGFVLVLRIKAPAVTLEKRPFLWKDLLEPTSLPVSCTIMISCIAYGAMMNYTALYASTELPAVSAGVFFFFLAVGSAFARVLAGKAFDRSGPARAAMLAYLFMFAGFGLRGLATGAVPFYASALLIGTGFGTLTPVLQAMVNGLVAPARRGAANATYMTAFDAGICLGLIFTGYAYAAHGWAVCQAFDMVVLVAGAVVFRVWALPHYEKGTAGRQNRPGVS